MLEGYVFNTNSLEIRKYAIDCSFNFQGVIFAPS
jgi:hypothetical protein